MLKAPKHILITGASSGIGAGLALAYAAPGILLSLHGRHEVRLKEVAQKAEAKGAAVTMHCGSVIDSTDLTQWIEACDQRQPLDLVIANAGISAGTMDGGESADQVRTVFSINVEGTFNTIQPVIPLMKKRRQGQIALVSSLASFRGMPGAPAYCASKAAVRIYGEGLRPDLARFNVALNVICPGFVKTPMTDVNQFKMPFLMSVDKAALFIQKGLRANRGRIAFPWPFYAVIRAMAFLPEFVMEFISARTPRK